MESAKPIVYLIRHGEKPAQGQGLSTQGMERAQCLRKVFGAESAYKIGHIMAQKPEGDGDEQRPLDTVKPLAEDLGLKVDTSCKRDDAKGVAKVVNCYPGPGNILICWEHHHLTNIVEKLSGQCPKYPDGAFNWIWTLPPPYEKGITDITSEDCPGLDS